MEGGGHESSSASSNGRRRKRYYRHSAEQIQRLEAAFKECPHPDEKKRLQLSRELGLEHRQIKFWFQNRRTQLKAQHDRADNNILRADNDKIRCENIVIKEALKKVICPSCGGPSPEETHLEEQRLRLENIRLREELDKATSFTAKYVGRPVSQTIHSTSVIGSLDFDILGDNSSLEPLPLAISGIPDVEKSVMVEMAENGMEELMKMMQLEEPLWRKSANNTYDVLNLDIYNQLFPKQNISKNPIRVEATRSSGIVIKNATALVDVFMDSNKWMELFSTIVLNARTLEVITYGTFGNHSGTIQMMFQEMQVLSPLVPAREFFFLRSCQRLDQRTWAILDVSYYLSKEDQCTAPSNCLKLPSGCLIQDLPNGNCKVTWVEHVKIEEKNQSLHMYREHVNSGIAFGAQRWVSTLQRKCERSASLMISATSIRDHGGVLITPNGRRSMMKLTQRMVDSFCKNLRASNDGRRMIVSSVDDDGGIQVTVHRNTEQGQPIGTILSGATSLWLPLSSHMVFNFLIDHQNRAQWDLLSNENSVQEISHVSNGSHPGNCVSILSVMTTNQTNMLILQESCIDSSGSLVVFAPIDLSAVNVIISGEDSSYIPILSSGFTIIPDTGGASTSSFGKPEGCLLTISLQILATDSSELGRGSVETITNLVHTTLQHIKSSFSCV